MPSTVWVQGGRLMLQRVQMQIPHFTLRLLQVHSSRGMRPTSASRKSLTSDVSTQLGQ